VTVLKNYAKGKLACEKVDDRFESSDFYGKTAASQFHKQE
jgi:hypothetical protein